MVNIGIAIRRERMLVGLSQGDIEKRSGILRCTLSFYENGHKEPRLSNLQKIADAIGIPITRFFENE